MLKNTTIKIKILSVILLLALVACIGLAHLSNQFWKTGESYNNFISNDAMAALLTSRASGGTIVAVLQVARADDLAPKSEQMWTARQTFEKFLTTASERMAQTVELMPASRQVSRDIIVRLTNLGTLGNKAFDAFDAGDLQTGRAAVAEIFVFLDQITPLFVANNEAMTKSLIAGRDRLTEQTLSTITWSLLALMLGSPAQSAARCSLRRRALPRLWRA